MNSEIVTLDEMQAIAYIVLQGKYLVSHIKDQKTGTYPKKSKSIAEKCAWTKAHMAQ